MNERHLRKAIGGSTSGCALATQTDSKAIPAREAMTRFDITVLFDNNSKREEKRETRRSTEQRGSSARKQRLAVSHKL